jgi:tRNA(Ile)-lysidine synthase
MESLPDIARATSARHALILEGAPILALVSGGADSVALLRLLAAGDLAPASPLTVLHVNHLLRDADADADADFVVALCAKLGVSCRVQRYDVASWAAEEGLNLEDAGRRVRYRFAAEELDALCDALGVARASGRIAVAHSRDDRIETFLMRTITGAGAGGFASIPYRRDRIVRPLLDCDRAALREHLGSLGQSWREDASNADTTRLRAYIRSELVPGFERANPSFRDTLARSIDLLADDDDLLSAMADGFARDFAEVSVGERVEFDRSRMATLDRVMARRAMRSALLAAFPEASRIEAAHLEALVDAIAADSFARDLPGGLRARSEYGRLIVSRAGEASRAVAPSVLPIAGTADLGPSGRIIAELVEPDDPKGTPRSVTIDAGGLDQLVVDAPRPGDRMRPLGMEGSRKLSDMLIDAKVPRGERAATPVVRDGARVVWLAGVRMSEHYRVGAETVRAVRLTWQPQEPGR